MPTKISQLTAATSIGKDDVLPIVQGGATKKAPGQLLEARIDAVLDHGADPTGVADSTAAIQAAIDEAETAAGFGGGEHIVYLPGGTYRVLAGGLSITENGVGLRGAGRYATRLLFEPSADGQKCVTYDRAASPSLVGYGWSLKDLMIQTTDVTWDKVALSVVDSSDFDLADMYIEGFRGANTDSVGLEIFGRQQFKMRDSVIENTIVPLYIRINPNTTSGYLSADHFNFHNVTLNANSDAAATLTRANVLVEDGCHILNLSFTGSNPWVFGDYGFYFNNTGTPAQPDQCGTFMFEGVRNEQQTLATGYNFFISGHPGVFVREVVFQNCYLDVGQEGFHFEKVQHVNIIGTDMDQVSPRVLINIPANGDVQSMTWIGNEISNNISMTLSDCKEVFAIPRRPGYEYSHTAFFGYVNQGNQAGQFPLILMNGMLCYTANQALANTASMAIPIDTSESVSGGTMEVMLATTNGFEWAKYAFTDTGGQNGITKLLGTDNTFDTDAGAGLRVYNSAVGLSGTTWIKNSTGQHGTVSVTVFYSNVAHA